MPENTRLVDSPGPLWINDHHTYHGRNDTIPLSEAGSLASSLCLIRVASLKLNVFAPGEAFGNTDGYRDASILTA